MISFLGRVESFLAFVKIVSDLALPSSLSGSLLCPGASRTFPPLSWLLVRWKLMGRFDSLLKWLRVCSELA